MKEKRSPRSGGRTATQSKTCDKKASLSWGGIFEEMAYGTRKPILKGGRGTFMEGRVKRDRAKKGFVRETSNGAALELGKYLWTWRCGGGTSTVFGGEPLVCS